MKKQDKDMLIKLTLENIKKNIDDLLLALSTIEKDKYETAVDNKYEKRG